jgi:hypothetical protein
MRTRTTAFPLTSEVVWSQQMPPKLRIAERVPFPHAPRQSRRYSIHFFVPLLTGLSLGTARSSSRQMGPSSSVAFYSAPTRTALELGFSVDSFIQSSILNGNRVWICGWSLCSHRPFSRKDRAVAHVARIHIGTKIYSCRALAGIQAGTLHMHGSRLVSRIFTQSWHAPDCV